MASFIAPLCLPMLALAITEAVVGEYFTKMYFGLLDTVLPRSSTPTTLKAPHTSSSPNLLRNSGKPPAPCSLNWCDPSSTTSALISYSTKGENHSQKLKYLDVVLVSGVVSTRYPADLGVVGGEAQPGFVNLGINLLCPCQKEMIEQ